MAGDMTEKKEVDVIDTVPLIHTVVRAGGIAASRIILRLIFGETLTLALLITTAQLLMTAGEIRVPVVVMERGLTVGIAMKREPTAEGRTDGDEVELQTVDIADEGYEVI